MGWSWSLWFAQRTLADCMRAGCERVGLRPLMLEEKSVAPEFCQGAVICAPNVNNANIATSNFMSCQLALDSILAELEERHLAYHGVEKTSTLLRTVGVELNLSERSLRHSRPRMFRLDLCLGFMLGLPGVTGHTMRIVLGHIVNIFLLSRPGLSILDRCYAFAMQFGAEFGVITNEVRHELSAIRSLLPVVGVDLATAWCPVAFCSDASLQGYALAVAHLGPDKCAEALGFASDGAFVRPLSSSMIHPAASGPTLLWTSQDVSTPPLHRRGSRPTVVAEALCSSTPPLSVHHLTMPSSVMIDGSGFFAELLGSTRTSCCLRGGPRFWGCVMLGAPPFTIARDSFPSRTISAHCYLLKDAIQ